MLCLYLGMSGLNCWISFTPYSVKCIVEFLSSEIRVRLNWFKPSSKIFFTDRSKVVLLLCILFVIYVSCRSCCQVCSLQPCDLLLGMYVIFSRLCFTFSCGMSWV